MPDDNEPPTNKRLEYLKLWVERRIATSRAMRAKCQEGRKRSTELHEQWLRHLWDRMK